MCVRVSPRLDRPGAVFTVALLCVLGGAGGLFVFTSGPADGGSLQFEAVGPSAGFEYTAGVSSFGNGRNGVYVADVNDDGWDDVLAIGGERPALFVNEGGEFRRSDRLPALDITVQGALFFDAAGDGHPDLLLLPRHGQPVYLANDGGEFERRDAGLDLTLNVSVSATAGDFDRDGDLDLFVVQYGNWADGLPAGYYRQAMHLPADNGARNYVFENVGGTFERRSVGVRGAQWTLAASAVDLTGDGYPDVHVANDFNSDVVYVNQRDGTFERRVLGNDTARNAMASEVFDANGDGTPDVFVTNIDVPLTDLPREKYDLLRDRIQFVFTDRNAGNNLLVNSGNATFVDRAPAMGVQEGGWGWAAAATDLDNDGDRDLFHATQTFVRVNETAPVYTYPMVFEREGEDFRRRDASALGFAETDGRGVAHLDFDRDGDQDLVVAVADGRYRLYENTGAGTGALQVELTMDGRSALGATVEVVADGERQTAFLNAKADYQSQDTRTLHVGLGGASVDRVVVTWPDGSTSTYTDLAAGERVVLAPDGVRERTEFADSGG